MKKFFYNFGLVIFLGLNFLNPVKAEDNIVELKLFYGIGCPHCALEKEFIDKIITKYQDKVSLREYEVYYNQENAQIFNNFVKDLKIEIAGVPLLLINDEYVLGYGSDDTTGVEIEEKIKKLTSNEPISNEEKEINTSSPSIIESVPEKEKIEKKSEAPVYLNIFSKKIDLKGVSLPIATILIAFVDGFNPCAMWILVFLITMLINMKDKKKRDVDKLIKYSRQLRVYKYISQYVEVYIG